MSKIFFAGDSITQTYYYNNFPRTGIGQMFYLFIKKDYIVENHARGGRSTKSFINESRLKVVEDNIQEGDFLFIQFGHNDEKAYDPSRYTEPFSSYIDNLGVFINVARRRGAYPVLITPAERRCFEDNKQLGKGTLADYVAGMKMASEKYKVPLVDLYSMSRTELENVGEEQSRKWYMFFSEGLYTNYPDGCKDNTHLSYEGAVKYASLIAKGLRKLGGIYADMLLDEGELNK